MHLGDTTRISHSGVWRRDLVFSDALLDEVAGGGWREAGSKAEQGIESHGGVTAAVPPEDELVEVTPEVLATEAMIGIDRRALGPVQGIDLHVAVFGQG